MIYLGDIFIFNKTLEKCKKYIHFILIILNKPTYISTYIKVFSTVKKSII